MLQTSIFEKRWLDLVFEGKNKAYGAYQLRLESPRTTMLAMLYALLFIGGAAGGGFLLSSFGHHPSGNGLPPIENDTLVITPYRNDPVEPVLPKPKKTQTKTSVADPIPEWRNDPVVAPPDERNTDPVENPPTGQPDPATGTDTGTTAGPGTATDQGTNTVAPVNPGPVPPGVLDRQPMFPGGMPAFYSYVGNNFDKPELDEAKIVRIFVSFVIEKDGSMTDIEVRNKPGYALEKEAIRVLKSLKKKWTPGIKAGQPVRVLYTLPIVIRPE